MRSLLLCLLLVAVATAQDSTVEEDATTTVSSAAPPVVSSALPPLTSTIPPPRTSPRPVQTTTVPDYQNSQYCQCNPSSIWLDIVFLVDSSKAMATGVEDVLGTIRSILYSLTLGGNAYQSRAAIVTYADQVNTNYDFGSIKTLDDVDALKLPLYSEAGENIAGAMGNAKDIFARGLTSANRTNVRQVMVIIASSYNGDVASDPAKIAQQFKEDGGSIMTIEYVQQGQSILPSFSALASPGYSISTRNSSAWDGSFIIYAFCDMNCFCLTGQTSYHLTSERENPLGGCYDPVTAKAVYRAAKITCRDKFGFVATPHDADKQFFLMGRFSGSKIPYWIGYEYDGSKFNWADNVTDSSWTNWANGQPDTTGNKNCVYSVQTSGFQSRWYSASCQDILKADYQYVCELRPCDSTYYCF